MKQPKKMKSTRSIHVLHVFTIAAPIMMLVSISYSVGPACGQFDGDPAPGVTTPAGRPASLNVPPPIGSGSAPVPVIQGDGGAPKPPPSGIAQSSRPLGTDFPHQSAQQRVVRYQQRNDAQQRGHRMVNTRHAPDSTSNSIVIVDDSQLEEQENQDYPYPTASGKGPTIIHRYALKDHSVITEPAETKQHIPVTDEISMTALGKWQEQWTVGPRIHTNTESWHQHELKEPCPTTLKFARWGVLLGLIFATVFVAFSAYSVTLGHKGGGSRVIGSVGGLMLLLMGYSIYKLVMINAFRYPYKQAWDQIDMQEKNGHADLTANDTPGVPKASADRTNRSPLPVIPLLGPRNNN